MKNKRNILLPVIGLALTTGMAVSQPTLTLSGDTAVVEGIKAGNTAMLNIVGPEGYQFSGVLPAEKKGIVDLKKKLSSLPVGKYSYELLSRPEGKVVRGSFTIGQSEKVVSPPNTQTAPNPSSRTATEQQALTEDDSIWITDTQEDGITFLVLESADSPTVDQNWKFYNQEGVLEIRTGDPAANPAEVNRMTINRDGDVKILTGNLSVKDAVGASGLTVSSTGPWVAITDTDGGTGWKLYNDNGKFALNELNTLNDIIIVEEGSQANSLVITSSGVSVLSSRETKSNISPVSAKTVLEKLRKLPIYTWSYTKDSNKAVHIGPMAEEFHQQFGYGSNAKRISTLDTGGLALAGVKALQQELERRDAEIAELKKTVALLLEKSK